MTEIAALGLRVDGAEGVERSASALDHLTKSADSAEKAADRLNKESGKSKKALDDVAKSGEDASGSVSSLAAAASRAGALIGAAFSVTAIARYADAWSDLTSRIQVNIGSQGNAADVMARLGDISRTTYSSLEATADSFARNSFTLKALGKSTEEQLNYTEALNNALVVSGAKGHAFELVQNSMNRAMAEGTMRGQELDIVLNYGSRVAELLAGQLGVNVTQLRAMAKEGKITGDVIYSALTGNMELLHEQAESMPATIGDAFILLRNAVLETVGVFDQQAKVSEDLATAIVDISDAIRNLDKSALVIFAEESRREFQLLGTAIGGVAAMIAKGFSVGGLEQIRFIWAEMKQDLADINSAFDDRRLERDIDELLRKTNLFGLSAEKAGRNVTSSVASASESIDKLISSMEEQIALFDKTSKTAKTRYQIENNLIEGLTGDKKEYLLLLLDELDMLENGAKLIKHFKDEEEKRAAAKKATVDALTLEVGWMQKEVAARRAGESALAEFNREKHIESALRQENVESLLPDEIEKYRELLGVQYDLQQEISNLSDQADPLASSWQAALERIDNAFVDLWKSAFNGFKDFADSLKNAFIQLLAELAHRATTQKILVSLGFTGASGGAMAGVAGGGGGGGGLMGNIFSAGSWISAGKTLWEGFSGLAAGQGLSGFSGILGRFGAEAAFESAALKGGLEAAWAQADAAANMSKFTNTVGPILAGIGGAIQGWQSGNKANAITGAIGGWGGAKAGAVAGSYILPGIGTAIGAVIGGILGSSLGSSVFGGAWEDRRQGIQLGFDEEGLDLEDWVRQTKKGGWFSSTKRRYVYSEMEEGLASEFQTGYDAMIDVLGTQFMAIGADLDRAVFEAVRIGSESINTSDQTEEQVQEQIEKWFSDLQQAMVNAALNAAGDPSAAVRLLRATGGDVEMLGALGGLMGVAGINAVQQARDAQTQLTMVETYRAVTDATRTLIGEYDGSLEATLGLTEAMAIQQEMAFGLATAYLQASDAVGALFGNLKESIRTSLMGAEELYEYQRGQVHSLTDMLSTLSDPEAIYRASQEIERLVSGMWGRLDEDQRSTLGDEFLDYLDRTEALAQDRLAQGLADLESSQSDIYSALTSQMNDVADRMIETADRMQAAADLQWQSSMQFGAYVQQMGGIMSGANQGMEQNA